MSHRVAVSALFLLAIALLPGCGPQPAATPSAPATAFAPPSPPPPPPPPPTAPPGSIANDPGVPSANTSAPDGSATSQGASSNRPLQQKAFETPEAVFHAAVEARIAFDFELLRSYCTKEGFDIEVGDAVGGIHGVIEMAPPPLNDSFRALAKKYQLKTLESQMQLVLDVAAKKISRRQMSQILGADIKAEDQLPLLNDFNDAQLEFAEAMKAKNPVATFDPKKVKFVLKEVTIEADKAFGEFEMQLPAPMPSIPPLPVYFVKKNDGWLLDGCPAGPPPETSPSTPTKSVVQPPIQKKNASYDRPEAAFRAMRQANLNQDFDAVYACYTEEGMYHDIGQTVVILDTSISFGILKSIQKDGTALLRKHGYLLGSAFTKASKAGDPKGQKHYETMVEIGRSIPNPKEFIEAFWKVMIPRDEEGNVMDIKVKEYAIEKLVLGADRATLTLTAQGPFQPEGRLILQKTEIGWQITNNPAQLVEGEGAQIMDPMPPN